MTGKDKNNRILIVAAHPDDEILGCGSTMAKYSSANNEVWVLILGEGIRSRSGEEDVGGKIEKLKIEARQANELVGVSNLVFANFSDNSFDSMPLLKIIHRIEEVFKELKPNIVFTHSVSDVNIDHQITFKAMQAVSRPVPGNILEVLYSFEVPSSTNWNFGHGESFIPNVFFDVSHFFDVKKNALSKYSSEMRPFPHPRSFEFVESLGRVRGGQVGFKYAEAFQLIYQKKL